MKKHPKSDILSKKPERMQIKTLSQLTDKRGTERGFAESSTGKARLFLTVTQDRKAHV